MPAPLTLGGGCQVRDSGPGKFLRTVGGRDRHCSRGTTRPEGHGQCYISWAAERRLRIGFIAHFLLNNWGLPCRDPCTSLQRCRRSHGHL